MKAKVKDQTVDWKCMVEAISWQEVWHMCV
jgi:hypothetical protein